MYIHTYIYNIYIYPYIYIMSILIYLYIYILLGQNCCQCYNLSSFRNYGRGFIVNKQESKEPHFPFNFFRHIMTDVNHIPGNADSKKINKEPVIRSNESAEFNHNSVCTARKKRHPIQ